MGERAAAKSINNQLAVLRKLLNLAAEYRKLDHAPKVKALKQVDLDYDFLDFEEAERFLAAASPEWKPLVQLALRTGLRNGELLSLKWEDIDLKAGKLMVKRTLWRGLEGTPKGGKKAGLPKRLTFHDLRHTFASHLVMRGRSLVEVQQLLGHSTIQMTMRYAHLSPDVKRDAVESLEKPSGKVGQQVGND